MTRAQAARHPLLQSVEAMVYSRANYYLALVLDVVACVAFVTFGWVATQSSYTAALAIAGGYLAWGLLEYIIHRWVGHGRPSIARRGHAAHHADETARVASPMFMIVVGAALAWLPLAALLDGGTAALLVGGAYLGYNHYALMHHAMHHHPRLTLRLGFRRVERYHRSHHRQQTVNFGVTLTLWDRVFGTYCADTLSKTSRS